MLSALKQHITELKTENAKLRKENTEICDLRFKLSVSDAEIAELKRMHTKVLKVNKKYNEMYNAKNAKLKAIIEKLKSENIEFRDRLTKVKQNQLQDNSKKNNTKENVELRDCVMKVKQKQILNDNTPNDNFPNDNTLNNNSSNFNSGVDQVFMRPHHEKSLEDKEMDAFLIDVNKKSVGDDIR